MLGGRGRYYLFAGRAQWPRVLEAERDAFLRLDAAASPEGGSIPPLLADLNGDGRDDLITSSPSAMDTAHRFGSVGILMGAASPAQVRSYDNADVVIRDENEGGAFGRAFSATDVTMDGILDLIVSEPGTGRVLVLAGRRDWLPRGTPASFQAVVLVTGQPGTGRHGIVTGDFDGDSAREVALCVRGTDRRGRKEEWAALVTPYLPIGIDIRPAAEPNVILRASGSVLAVGISSARTARVSELDPESFRLASMPPTHSAWRDFDNDGTPDLQLYFDAAALPVREGVSRLALIGRTRRGLAVAGADAVSVVPAGVGSANDGDRRQ
jgi:hypothetical protein